ncbi:MAG: hypothetical protein GY714_10560 [Desulfobacterales bacterium]|nr:hypothetical protein [Desulfobacterales bacterium]
MKTNQTKIDQYTDKLLKVLTDPEDVYDFICALANTRSRLENKIGADVFKLSVESVINKSR